MMYYLYVAIFGAFGAVSRYWISSSLSPEAFPYNTLMINILGCFLLSIVVKYLTTLNKLPKNLVNALGTGFIGSFTTFSAFSVEVSKLIIQGSYFFAVSYVIVSVAGGFLSAGFGFILSSHLIKRRELKDYED